MKSRLLWFASLGLLSCAIAVIALANAINRPESKNVHKANSITAQQDLLVSTSRIEDPSVSKIISERQEIKKLLVEIRTAKDAGQTPSQELYDRLYELRPVRDGGGRLDQGGETCATATVISTTPYSDSGTTSGYLNDIPECQGSGTSPDVVYSFTPAITGNYHISLCGSFYDTKLAVYANTCTGTPIACNDDGVACGDISSDIPGVALTSGVTYFIIVDGWDNGSFGDYVFYLEEVAPPPTGDVCGDPILIPSLPFSANNVTTCGGYTANYNSPCVSNSGDGPDVVYSFTLTSVTSVEVIMNSYLAPPPNETWVMPGLLLSDHCPPDGNCIASASGWTIVESIPLALTCSNLQPGTYYVVVDNGTWFHPCFDYDLLIQECGPCDLVSQPGDIEEVTEAFPLPGTFSLNDPNGGCNNSEQFGSQFQNIDDGQTIHGRTFAYMDSITASLKGDTDWYRLVLATPQTLTVTYTGETSLQASLYRAPCGFLPIQNGIQTTPCGTRVLATSCLDPGEYFVKIGRGGAFGSPDAQPFEYRASFELAPCELPPGRCCYTGGCVMNTYPECVILDGYWDESLTCGDPCPVYPPNDRCENAGVPASLPATFTGDNTNATNDCQQEGDPQVWHVFTTTEVSDIQIDYCGTQNFHSFNPWIYNSCPCDERIMLEAVDWGFCFPITAMTGLWRDVPAGTWYISVTLYNPNSIGEYTIHVNAVSNQPPANDECASATPITVVPNGEVTVTGTTMNATVSCTDACVEGGFTYNSSGGDVFYSLNLNSNRRIAMALGTSDMHISVYEGLDMCCTSPALLCNDDDENFLPLPEWDVPEQHPGDSRSYVAADLGPGLFLIRVAKYASQVGAYSLTVYDNGSLHCTPPNTPDDLTAFIDGGNIQLRWSTDAASAERGTYRIWSNTDMMPFGDPSWAIVADDIVPVVADDHLYYSGPLTIDNRTFYVVTGHCTDAP